VDGQNILVRDTPAGFAEAVTEVLANPGLRSSLGECGRRTVEDLYSWDTIGSRIRELYLRLA
jgi:phosphatidylinositol alpha-1,6-mannosyltransferase